MTALAPTVEMFFTQRLATERDQRKKSIFEIKLIVEPQIVFHGVVRRAV